MGGETGKVYTSKPPHVAWRQVCLPKNRSRWSWDQRLLLLEYGCNWGVCVADSNEG